MYLMISILLVIIYKNLLSHPMFIMIMIIMYSIIICLNISLWKINFIYSILLFLIMISGLLIMFLYFSSLISNEQMQLIYNKKFFYINFLINLIMFYILMFMNKSSFYNIMNFTSKESLSLYNLNEKWLSNIYSLYMYPFNNITMLSIIYLLISLFSIIKISSMNLKPLRKIN
uniref:NADH dehydrogenase subunit 6 n=1 Tax=Dolichoderus sibiricus TaxID=609446 RepID=A0A6B9BLU4_9HYME|nr:NADH dehydrogenase subunit 6 [Dolichoderus sibiricus]